uniref:Uncharacterized protein n=1 Tax=Bionectria ochroleuca TaxID=29856 RepID=A0A8H7TTN1_BIOOC
MGNIYSKLSLIKSLEKKPIRSQYHEICSIIFSNLYWIQVAKTHYILPVLIGADLLKLQEGDRESPKNLFLALYHDDPGIEQLTEFFFGSLKRAYHDEKARTVYFKEWNLTLHISAIEPKYPWPVQRPNLMFAQESKGPYTCILYLQPEASIEKISNSRIGGLCKERPKDLSNLTTICSVLIRLANGEEQYVVFRDTQPNSLIYEKQCYKEKKNSENQYYSIGPWRFSTSKDRED